MISEELLKTFEEDFQSDPKNQASRHAIARVGIKDASYNQEILKKHDYVFSHETEKGKITDQKSSGRCWMFAALNTIRVQTMDKLNVEDFEFSQNYTLFWDKLERSNYVMESLIDTLDEDLDSRLVWHLLQDPLQDGGQWEMFAGILKKYGSVPKSVMPESFHSSRTNDLNDVLNQKVREFTCRARQMKQDGASLEAIQEVKEKYLSYIYTVLVKALGNPPQVFDYAYRDKDGNHHVIENITPQNFFAQYTDTDLDDMVSLIHAPSADKEIGKTYTVKYLASVEEADPIKYLNVPIEVLKEAAIEAIKDGYPVWFGCDVGKMSDSKSGIMDLDLYQLEDSLGQNLDLSKGDRLQYSASLMTHAMVLVGVDLASDGSVKKWKVENSWGKKAGDEGIFSMTDAWFDEYTYQITLPKKYVDDSWLEKYAADPIELEPWDPMGALAFMK